MSMEFYTATEFPDKNKGFLVYGIDPEATGTHDDGREWKGLVICKMVNCEYDAYNFLHELFAGSCVNTWQPEYLLAEEYVAMSKCSVEDSFDEEEGMKIARNRVLQKYRRDKLRIFSCFETELLLRATRMGREMSFLANKIGKEIG